MATTIDIDWKWWDGRERAKSGSVLDHALIAPLGGSAIAGLDPPLDNSFEVAHFTCGTAAGTIGISDRAENDGFPRNTKGKFWDKVPGWVWCSSSASPDPAHPSDNFENTGGSTNVVGHNIQPSTSIGWWRFQLRPDNEPPLDAEAMEIPDAVVNHSGRGLVGVLLSTTGQVGDSWRPWHEAPCQLAQSANTRGPLHAVPFVANGELNELVSLFNVFDFDFQATICDLQPRGQALECETSHQMDVGSAPRVMGRSPWPVNIRLLRFYVGG